MTISATRSPRNLLMKPLSKWQNVIFVVGAVLMVIGAVSSVFRWSFYPYVFSIGAVGYAVVQMMQQYEGNSFVVRRLLRIQAISGLLLILTGVLMIAKPDLFAAMPFRVLGWALIVYGVIECINAIKIHNCHKQYEKIQAAQQAASKAEIEDALCDLSRE